MGRDLNSNCDVIDCKPGSRQYEWLSTQLADSSSACTLAYWHHPRFSSGTHGDYPLVQPLWELMAGGGVDVLLGGHDHNYERLAPLDSAGDPSPEGVRSFVVGTGGAPLREAPGVSPASEALIDDAHGVLRLELGRGDYAWSFLTVDGQVADSGVGTCTNDTPGSQ